MNYGDRVRIKPRPRDKRKSLTGWLVAIETGGRNPVVSLDEESCKRLNAQSATFTCNPKRLEIVENE